MKKADLHIHTTYSDGILTPREVVIWAHTKGISDIAVTDHDTTEGIEEAVKYSIDYNLNVIPGIELSCTEQNDEVHILGYFIDYKSPIIKSFTEVLKNARESRNIEILKKLNKLDIDISIDEVRKISKDGSMGRPHIAKALINKGIVDTVEGAFKIYLGYGKPAYVERFKISVKDGIKLIHSIGGVAVMAHPGLIHNQRIIKNILKEDIDGIEVIHCKHTEAQTKHFTEVADNLNLIKTAGSDCHGYLENGMPKLGDFNIDSSVVTLLKEKADFYKKTL